MSSSRKQRWQQLQSVFEPGFRRMLLVSLLLHLLLPTLYYTPLFPRRDPVKPPVYRVNLVNKPVKNPQAGRPEATQAKKPPKKVIAEVPKPIPRKPKPKPVEKPKPIPPKPKPKPAPPKPEPKPVAKPKPEPKPKVSRVQENALQKRLEELRAAQVQKQAEAERQAKLDALRAAAAAESQKLESPVINAPVGMPDGKGDEVGVDQREYVREFITQQWRLSQYQLDNRRLEAEVTLVYSAEGVLLHYRFEEKSGNEIFDSSLQRAILKSKDLGQSLQEETTFQVVFNLKEMLDRP